MAHFSGLINGNISESRGISVAIKAVKLFKVLPHSESQIATKMYKFYAVCAKECPF